MSTAQDGPQGRAEKASLPKLVLWEGACWQFGEHPPCCRRNAEGYHIVCLILSAFCVGWPLAVQFFVLLVADRVSVILFRIS